ncbi:MAG TPA: putative glycoside hydrolase [Chloroflexota bacterium]
MYSNRGWSYSSAPPRGPHSAHRQRRFRPRAPRLPRLAPLPLALAIVAVAAWYHFAFSGFRVSGMVVDELSGAPIGDARVWAMRASTVTGADGAFAIDGVKPPEVIGFDAPGYQAESTRISLPYAGMTLRLQPIAVELDAVDAETGEPVAASLETATSAGESGPGHLRVAPVRQDQKFNLTAAGYVPTETYYTGQAVLRVPMQPRLDGRVVDGTSGQSVPGALISVDGAIISTGADGTFQLRRRPREGLLQVLAPGYRRGQIDLSQPGGLDVRLQPNPVRATYMTYFAIGSPTYRQDLFDLLDTTEINAVVVDIKGDYGLLSYHSRVPVADQIGANSAPTIDDLDGLLADLHQHGAYVIGRIVVFKDNVLARNGARAGLDVAVRDRRTGEAWVDGEKLAWVDPFQSAAWDYNTALAQEAIQRGFDEVQFDYIRFATDPAPDSTVEDIQYSRPLTETNRVSALKGFLGQAHKAVNEAGGFLSMDTFGYTTWWTNDGGIGQDLDVLSDDIDYYCPMIYPSTFNAGLPGGIPYPDVVSRPYDVVFQSLKHVQQKLQGKRAVIRPWLQYFDDYPWATQTRYDAPQILAQKQAVADSNLSGWMLWNAGSLFKRGGLAPR